MEPVSELTSKMLWWIDELLKTTPGTTNSVFIWEGLLQKLIGLRLLLSTLAINIKLESRNKKIAIMFLFFDRVDFSMDEK